MGRPRSDIAPRIVHAARKQFLEAGVDGASLRTIASEAGTSIGMVYYYYPTKDDLFFAVVEETYAKIVGDLQRALTSDDGVEQRLLRAFSRVAAMNDDEMQVVRLVIREALVSSQRLDRFVERSMRGHLPLLLGVLAGGLEEGALDPSFPLPLLMLFTAGVGVLPQFVLKIAGKRVAALGLPQGDALARVLVDVLLHGVGRRDDSVRPKSTRPLKSRTRDTAGGRRPRAKASRR